MSGTKFGPEITCNARKPDLDVFWGGARAIKLVGSIDEMAEMVRGKSGDSYVPGLIPLYGASMDVILRPITYERAAQDDVDRFVAAWKSGQQLSPEDEGDAAGKEWFSAVYSALVARGLDKIAWVETPNEPDYDASIDVNGIAVFGVMCKWWGAFLLAAVTMAVQVGQPIIWGNFPVGTPQLQHLASPGKPPDTVRELYPVMALTHRYPALVMLGLHEYAPDTPMVVDGALLGRYKALWDTHIGPKGWTKLRIALTEFNFDFYLSGQPKKDINDVDRMEHFRLYGENVLEPDDRIAMVMTYAFDIREELRFNLLRGDTSRADSFFRAFVNHLAAHPYRRDGAPPPIEPPPPTDPPPVPGPVNLLKNASFEGGYRFAEDDRLGDRKIPTGWFVGWNADQAAPHLELDQHPPRVRDGAVALRMWADKRFNAWAGQKVQVEPGAMYRLTVQAIASRETQKPASVHVGIDLDGGEDYQAAELKHGYTSLEEWKNPTIEFKAIGPQVTVFVNARTGEDGRGDAWFDDVRLVKVADAPPVEPPPAPAVGWYRVDTSTPTNPDSKDRLRFRAAPVNGAVIGLAAPTSEWQFESFKDGWGKLKGAELYASAQYLIKKV